MNNKFFQLPPEKQQRIMNAAFKVFAQNSYKKAPMSTIAEESGISKALLFHYFTNKLELYMFLWNKSIEQIQNAFSEYHVLDTSDFFEILHRSLLAKCSVIRVYPFLYQFAASAYYEQDLKIQSSVQENFNSVSSYCEDILWQAVNTANFHEDVDIKLFYQEVVWISDGYLRQMMMSKPLQADRMQEDFERMIEQWKKVYLKG